MIATQRRAPGDRISEPATGVVARPRERWITTAALALLAVGVGMRLNNAVRYPSLHGFDAYAHVTYVWHLLRTGDLPLPSDGWGRFHPPLYYALCAAMWSVLRRIEPSQVLKIIGVVFAVASLGSALVSWAFARRCFPGRRDVAILAPLFVLFLPVNIYVTPMFGNEVLTILLCSLACYVLLRLLEEQRLRDAILLGTILGLALLTKFTAIVMFAASCATIGLATVARRRWRIGAVHLLVVAAMVLVVAGWFYARNARLYGNPFQMSREYFVTRRIESTQAKGERGLHAYLSFDPQILNEPLYLSGSVVDSVWTGAFASTWFDAFGNWFLPYTATTKAVGRVLLVLGFVPTFCVVLGFAAAVWRLVREGWSDVLAVTVVVTAAMLAMFVIYTHANRIMSAVKASYMLPAIVPFSICFALGVETAVTHVRRSLYVIAPALVALLAVIIPVYTYQLLFEVGLGPHHWNAVATIDYFAGFRDKARTTFTMLARDGDFYLAHENLASIALEQAQPAMARRELRRALQLVRTQAVVGGPADRALYVKLTRADYYNSLAVIEDRLGRSDRALRAAEHAVRLDRTLPEAHYDLAVLLLERGAAARAVTLLETAVALDPGFGDAAWLLGVAQQRAGDCDAAVRTLDAAAAVHVWPRRTFPHAVGTGDLHDAGIVRHRQIASLPPDLGPERALAKCQSRGAVG